MEHLALCSKEELRSSLGFVDTARELYELASSYSACTVLLTNAMREQNQMDGIHLNFECYGKSFKGDVTG